MQTISLNGLWDFFYGPEQFEPGLSVLPAVKEYSGKMRIPGYWDDHYELFDEEDFFGLTARFNPDYRKPHFPMGRSLTPHAASSFLIGSGFYRKEIELAPAGNEKIFLQAGPAMWGCAVYCNGRLAGHTTGYSVGSVHDLTNLVRQGLNEIIIVVCNRHDDGGAYHRLDKTHDGLATGCRAGQHRGLAAMGYQAERGGINGGVSLRITGKSAIKDWFVSYENQKPHWHFELVNGAASAICWAVKDGAQILDSGTVDCAGKTEIDFESDTVFPQLWSDDAPKLYQLEITLTDGENTLDTDTIHWAPRTLVCRGTQLILNGLPIFLRGATEHCYFPETTNPHFNKEKYVQDLTVLKNAGFNFIRCHTWCPPEPFYDACDELGILVQTEFPAVYSEAEAEAIIRMVRRHSCAALFCEGNEKLIDDKAIERLKKVAAMLKKLAPGMLFNPQEAVRGVEYDLQPGAEIKEYPFPHDAEKMERIADFSDVIGGLCYTYFSYDHDGFPGTEKMEEILTAYCGKPCLSHEIGILGGYLNFDLEKRYENTFIGTDMFSAARKNMEKHGVYQNRKKYYQNNCLFISSVRKQLIENLRGCNGIAGYDYLGGIDTHWHLIGYPCGFFDEFYGEKYGETIADIRRYNNDSILLCSIGKYRNFFADSDFSATIKISNYHRKELTDCRLTWQLTIDGETIAEDQTAHSGIPCGAIHDLASVKIHLPPQERGKKAVLHAVLTAKDFEIRNQWDLWIFPRMQTTPRDALMVDKLTSREIEFMQQGGGVLLCNNFPGETLVEMFRTHTSGRSLGHAGALINRHAVWQDFPHDDFADWQFYELMDNSKSLVHDPEMPPFNPLMELIPSFKLVKHKAMLAEYQVGAGRLMICGLNLDSGKPAAEYLKYAILKYLSGKNYTAAPEWDRADLLRRISSASGKAKVLGKKIDEGGRPIDD